MVTLFTIRKWRLLKLLSTTEWTSADTLLESYLKNYPLPWPYSRSPLAKGSQRYIVNGGIISRLLSALLHEAKIECHNNQYRARVRSRVKK